MSRSHDYTGSRQLGKAHNFGADLIRLRDQCHNFGVWARHVEGISRGCYNRGVLHASDVTVSFPSNPATVSVEQTVVAAPRQRVSKRGQVAQVVERSPEKAGVGGSTPSLATIIPKILAAKSQNFQLTTQPISLTELAP